jgi:hypothetical protein
MVPHDLVRQFIDQPWWQAGRPDSSVAEDPGVVRRQEQIAQRRARAEQIPNWARPGASSTEFQSQLDRISKPDILQEVRQTIASYVDGANSKEMATDVFTTMSGRMRDVSRLIATMGRDEWFRQESAVAESAKPRRSKRKTTTKTRAKPKRRKKEKEDVMVTGKDEHEVASGFDGRFFV